jgi:3-deoxy-D-manno-octulosonate 8-phosphate phosphatase KdsC-like HAD superfamily phosphatase
VAYVGNDVNDLGCLALVGWPIATPDAHPTVLAAARLVLTRHGGDGAVREVCDLILQANSEAGAERLLRRPSGRAFGPVETKDH